MRVCQFRHFGEWTSMRGSLAGYLSGEQLSILQTLEPLSNTLSGMSEASQSSYCFTRFDE